MRYESSGRIDIAAAAERHQCHGPATRMADAEQITLPKSSRPGWC